MAQIEMSEPCCCSCLFASSSPNANVVIMPAEGDFELFASEMAATVAGENVVIEGDLFVEYPQFSMEMGTIHGELKMAASNKEQENPLMGMQAAMIGALQIREYLGLPFYHFSGSVTVDASHGHHHYDQFALRSIGFVTLDLNTSSEPYEFPATAELNVTFFHAGLVDEPAAQAPSQPECRPSSVPEHELPAQQRQTLTSPGKRKRSSAGDGVRCGTCLGSLDAILDHGLTLHAARCGHLLCSQCVLGLNREPERACRLCLKPIHGVRRLYGV